MKQSLRVMIGVIVFLIISSFGAEYLINRSDSTIFVSLFLLVESVLLYFLIIKPLFK